MLIQMWKKIFTCKNVIFTFGKKAIMCENVHILIVLTFEFTYENRQYAVNIQFPCEFMIFMMCYFDNWVELFQHVASTGAQHNSTAAHQASPFRSHTLYAPLFQLSCSCKTPCLLEDLLDSCCWCLSVQSVKMSECDTPTWEPINWSEARVRRGAETKNSECKSQTVWGVWAKIQKRGWDTREGTRHRPVFTLPRTS